MSMSLGVVAALLTLQHLRVSMVRPGLAVDVLTVAALRTEVQARPTIGADVTMMWRAQNAEGAAAETLRLRGIRRRVSR